MGVPQQAMGNKFGNKKIIVDGCIFDSKKEYLRYRELKLLEKAGKISNVQTQVKFILIPSQREPDTIGARGGIKKGKLLEKECSYYADFVYEENGETIVEDTKGYKDGQAYAVFTIKRKLMLYIHNIKVREL